MIWIFRTLFALVGVVIIGGCSSGDGDTKRHSFPIPRGVWQAEVTLPGGPLRFQFELSDGRNPDAVLINGVERVPVDDVTVTDTNMELRMGAFNSVIAATIDNGVLTGSLRLTKRGGDIQEMPFRAEYAQGYWFKPATMPSGFELDGRWAVTFRDDDGNTSPAIGEFRREGGLVFGTFLTPTGDYRYLAGDVSGDVMSLSCFDGAHAFLFRATMQADGTLAGDFWSGTKWHETWTAERDEDATLEDAFAATTLTVANDAFTFSFPDLKGKTVSLADSRFDGKVVLVTIAGSWCPNCHDEAAFLSEFYRENKKKGVEIVGLMFEHFRDERATEQVKKFRDRYNIGYPLLVAGYSDKAEATTTLGQLDRVRSFPTTIFLDKQHRVRHVHTGFSGPGTGEHYRDLTSSFAQIVSGLLAE